MKYIYTIIITLLLLTFAQFMDAQRSIVKSINLEGTQNVTLAMGGELSATEWDRDYIRITARIKLSNSTDDILKRLIRLGRYGIESKIKEGTLWLSMPKLERIVIIENQHLEEILSYEVQLPKGVTLNQKYGLEVQQVTN